MTIGTPDALKDGEVVILEVPVELMPRHNEAVDYGKTAAELALRSEEAGKLCGAAMTMFWGEIRKLNERAETALRKRDQALVVIEEKQPECQCLLCQLKRSGGVQP